MSPPYRQETHRAPCRARLRARCKKSGICVYTCQSARCKSHHVPRGEKVSVRPNGHGVSHHRARGTESHFGQMGRKSHYLPSGARSLIVSRAHLRSLYSSRARNKSRTYIIGAQDYRPQKWPKVSADGERAKVSVCGDGHGVSRWAERGKSLIVFRKMAESRQMREGRESPTDAERPPTAEPRMGGNEPHARV